jgi:hypothetical protein
MSTQALGDQRNRGLWQMWFGGLHGVWSIMREIFVYGPREQKMLMQYHSYEAQATDLHKLL